MEPIHFEAIKMAMKQDRSGYVLTLNVHPDEVPELLMRDFVGARYQVVMVRLNDDSAPMDRDVEYERDPVRSAGMLCRNPEFQKFLLEQGAIFEESETVATDWLKDHLAIVSRSDLRKNKEAARRFWVIKESFYQWKIGRI